MKDRSSIVKARKEYFDLGPLTDIREMLDRTCLLNSDKPVFTEKRDGGIVSHSASEVRDDVYALGTALLDLGLGGKHIALVGENSYLWIISHLAVFCGVGVIVPLDKELTDSGIERLISESDSEAVICSKTYLSTIRKVMENNPALKICVVLDSRVDKERFYKAEELMDYGRNLIAAGSTAYRDTVIDRNKCSAILYTSGTTGYNKGVMLSHKNIAANVDNVVNMIPGGPVSLSILPFNHAFAFNCHILPDLYLGINTCINDTLRNLISDLQLFKPNFSVCVPLFLELVYKNVWANAADTGRTKKLRNAVSLSNLLLDIGIDIRSIMFKPLIEIFGGKLEFLISGGAAANTELLKGMHDMGIDVYNGYGISECSPIVSINMNTIKDPYSVGYTMPSMEIRIDSANEDGIGEVCTRGDNVMVGYYKDEQATEASFTPDGWFKTGDYGRIDKKGRLVITGRKKNIIILDNGKNVHPEEIEAVIMAQLTYAREVVVFEASTVSSGIKKGTIAASMYVDREQDFASAAPEEMTKKIADDLRRVNGSLPAYKQVRKLNISPNEFTKTSTKKIVRQNVVEAYRESEGITI